MLLQTVSLPGRLCCRMIRLRLSLLAPLLLGVIFGVFFTSILTFRWRCPSLSERGDHPLFHPLSERDNTDRPCTCQEERTVKTGGHGSTDDHQHLVRPAGVERVERLHEEYAVREQLMVSVVSRQNDPNWLAAIVETWGRGAPPVLMFVGDSFNFSHPNATGLPLVRLNSGANRILSLVQYLSEHYLEAYQWFLLSMDDAYVRIDKLQDLLAHFSHIDRVYLGRSATGKEGDAAKLDLRPHEHYCLGSSGMVLSHGLLSALQGHLDQCLQENNDAIPGDVALGKCVSRTLDIQCTNSAQVSVTHDNV